MKVNLGCDGCIRRKTMFFPPSIECLALDDKPYYFDKNAALKEIERLNNIIEKTESMLKRLMEEQEYCYKKYPENWEERIGVSNTWLTSRDCYWSALNYLIKLKGNDKE